MVPRNDKPITVTSAARVARLCEHLSAALSAAGSTADTEYPSLLEPKGFDAHVARTACSLCRGWCCRNGDDHAFLDEKTLARVRRARPDMNASAILDLYRERVPATAYSGSCIFHGRNGCSLEQTLRSEVCNSYFCGGLHSYLTGGDALTPVTVIAGEGREIRTSSMLIPAGGAGRISSPAKCVPERRRPAQGDKRGRV